MNRLVALSQIEERLEHLPSEKLEAVSHFIACLENIESVCAICDFVTRVTDRERTIYWDS
jgi:hypothetical protein